MRRNHGQSAVAKHGIAGHRSFWNHAISYTPKTHSETGTGTAKDVKQGMALLSVGMEGLHG